MSIDMNKFISKVQDIPPAVSIGPPSGVGEEPPSEPFLIEFWGKLTSTAIETVDSDQLTPAQLAHGLRSLTNAEHGATWKQFSSIFD